MSNQSHSAQFHDRPRSTDGSATSTQSLAGCPKVVSMLTQGPNGTSRRRLDYLDIKLSFDEFLCEYLDAMLQYGAGHIGR